MKICKNIIKLKRFKKNMRLDKAGMNELIKFINRPENIFRIENKKDFDGMLEEYLNEPFVSSADPLTEYLRRMCSIQLIDQINVIPALFSNDMIRRVCLDPCGAIKIGNNIKKIESYAFINVTFNCDSVEIGSEISIIRNYAFFKCEIPKLVIPETFRDRIDLIFKDCEIDEIVYKYTQI